MGLFPPPPFTGVGSNGLTPVLSPFGFLGPKSVFRGSVDLDGVGLGGVLGLPGGAASVIGFAGVTPTTPDPSCGGSVYGLLVGTCLRSSAVGVPTLVSLPGPRLGVLLDRSFARIMVTKSATRRPRNGAGIFVSSPGAT